MTHEIWCLLGPMILRMLDELGALPLILAPFAIADLIVNIVWRVIAKIARVIKTIKRHFEQKKERKNREQEMKAKREEIRKKCRAKSQTTTQ